MIGEIVLYQLSAFDVAQINGRPFANPPDRSLVHEGQSVPAIVTADWGVSVNLHVLLDGQASYWATACTNGDQPGQWTARVRSAVVAAPRSPGLPTSATPA